MGPSQTALVPGSPCSSLSTHKPQGGPEIARFLDESPGGCDLFVYSHTIRTSWSQDLNPGLTPAPRPRLPGVCFMHKNLQ